MRDITGLSYGLIPKISKFYNKVRYLSNAKFKVIDFTIMRKTVLSKILSKLYIDVVIKIYLIILSIWKN